MQAVNAIFFSHCLMLCNAILTCCKLLHLSVVFITNFYIKLWYVTIRVVSVVRVTQPALALCRVHSPSRGRPRLTGLLLQSARGWRRRPPTRTTACSWRRPRARRCGAASRAARRCPTAGTTSTRTRRSASPARTARPPTAASTRCARTCASSTPRCCSSTRPPRRHPTPHSSTPTRACTAHENRLIVTCTCSLVVILTYILHLYLDVVLHIFYSHIFVHLFIVLYG